MGLLEDYEASIRDSGDSGGRPGPGCMGYIFVFIGIVFLVLILIAGLDFIIELIRQANITLPDINIMDYILKIPEYIPTLVKGLFRFIGNVLYSFTQIFYSLI